MNGRYSDKVTLPYTEYINLSNRELIRIARDSKDPLIIELVKRLEQQLSNYEE